MKLISENSCVKIELIEMDDIGKEIKDFGVVTKNDVFKRIFTYPPETEVMFPASKNYKE